MFEEILNIYRQIQYYKEEMLSIDAFIKRQKEQFKSLDGEKHLGIDSAIEELNNVRSNCENRQKACKADFCFTLHRYFGIDCSFGDDSIVLFDNSDEETVKYRQDLMQYWDLLQQEGFDNISEFAIIIENYNKICSVIKLLADFRKFVAETGKIKLEDMRILDRKLGVYETLEDEYIEFLNKINCEAKIGFYSNTIEYIINATSLIPLVFANNRESIKRPNNLNRYFRCQFHNSSDSPLIVSINKGYFHCYGCGKNGDQIDYLMEYENLSFDQAVYLLAEIFLIDIPDNPFKDSELANKYRSTITSEEYKHFIRDSYANVRKKHDDVDEIYVKLFGQIERIEKGEYDPDFVYEKKSKKYYYDLVRARKITLREEEIEIRINGNELPF